MHTISSQHLGSVLVFRSVPFVKMEKGYHDEKITSSVLDYFGQSGLATLDITGSYKTCNAGDYSHTEYAQNGSGKDVWATDNGFT